MPLIGCLRSLSCLYSWNAWVIPRTCASSRWGTWIADHDRADDARRVARRQHRHHRLDQVAVVEISRTVVSSWPASAMRTCSEFTTVSSDGTEDGIVHVHDLVAARRP